MVSKYTYLLLSTCNAEQTQTIQHNLKHSKLVFPRTEDQETDDKCHPQSALNQMITQESMGTEI